MTIARVVEHLSAPDYGLMRRVHRWRPPRWVRWWIIAATRAGDGWLWIMLAIVILVSPAPSRYEALSAAALSTTLGILIFRFLKRLVGRKRPCAIEPHCWAS